jgi:uncharacterized protein HemY
LARREETFAKAVNERPHDDALWLGRGRHFALCGRWQKAAAAYARVIESPSTKKDSYYYSFEVERAAVCVLAGDRNGYAAACARLRQHLGRTQDPVLPYLLARASALGLASKANALAAAKLAEQALAGKLPNDDWRAAALHVLGTACYRAGQFDKAAVYLSQSVQTRPAWIGASLNWPVLALAHHRLGHPKEARQWLDKSRGRLEQGKRDIAREPLGFPRDLHPPDWLEFQVLHREAEERLAEKKAASGK